MSAQLQNQAKVETPPPAQPTLRPARTPILQRKCACGGSPASSGTAGGCDECKKDAKGVQLYSADRGAWSILLGSGGHDGHGAQMDSKAAQSGSPRASHSFGQIRVRNSAPTPARKKRPVDEFIYGYGLDQDTEQSTDQAPGATSVGPAHRLAPATPAQPGGDKDRQPGLNGNERNRTKSQATVAEPANEPSGLDPAPLRRLLVDDDSNELASGQMRKTDFLDQLETVVRDAADSELARVGRSARECPYIARWIAFYRTRSSRHVEAALHRYAPESRGARSADEYIPVIAGRVRRAASVWAATGRITGMPDELASQIKGGGGLAAMEAFLARTPGPLEGANPRVDAGSVRPILDAVAPTPIDTEAPAEGDPQNIGSQLGVGGTLDTSVRSRMESAFGHDFSRVRVHTDGRAAALSSNLNARAFTVGGDIAFATGEYRPGDIVGEALIAHELAHVVQQEGATGSTLPLREEGEYDRLEQDADASAVGAMAALWGGIKGKLAGAVKNAKPAYRSGLSLQRCHRDKETCSVGMKTVSVDLIKLRGSGASPQVEFDIANLSYRKCCVQFVKGIDKEVADDNLNDRWLGMGDTDLTVSGTCGSVSAEEKALYDGAASEYKLSSRMRAFYVKTYSGYTGGGFSLPPYCATGTAAPYVNHIVLQDSDPNTGLAHELGHILLNSGDHHGIDNPNDPENLMAPDGGTGKIDDSQCKIIYNNT